MLLPPREGLPASPQSQASCQAPHMPSPSRPLCPAALLLFPTAPRVGSAPLLVPSSLIALADPLGLYLYVFFRKMSIQVLCMFFNSVFVFIVVELHEFFVLFWILVSCWIYHLQILSPVQLVSFSFC